MVGTDGGASISSKTLSSAPPEANDTSSLKWSFRSGKHPRSMQADTRERDNEGERHEITWRDADTARSSARAKQGYLGCRGYRLVHPAGRNMGELSPSQQVDDPQARSATGGHRTR